MTNPRTPSRKPIVAVLFAGASLAACAKDPTVTQNPPPPDPVPTTTQTSSGLPSWDSVPSGHPEGATNPPIPVLEVKDGACFKAWYDPRAMPIEARGTGARKLGPDETSSGTQVECTAELLAKVLTPPSE